MDYLSLALSIIFSVGAASCLALSIYFFLYDKHKRGIAFSTLMFLSSILAYVPQLDSIKSGFVDAKFNRTINQAQDTIATLTRMALINARVSYTTLAWGGRIGGPYARDKQLVLDDIDRQLSDLKVSQEDRRQISLTFVRLIASDLYNLFNQSMDRLIQAKAQRLDVALQRNSSETNKASRQQFDADVNEWRRTVRPDIPIEQLVLKDELQRAIPTKVLSDGENRAANGFATDLLKLFEGCERKGGYTDEAATFLDRHRELSEIDQKTKGIYGYTFE